ncbi:hypothetical protein DXG01_016715 [Tephrocybe rancida]|nr:hypothetical protein DXG01_016715 [Tephrocybe rancida]
MITEACPDSALDILWREQKTLAPLIQVMPNDLWEVEDLPDDDDMKMKTLKLRRVVRRTDLPRLEYYARKIRGFGEHTGDLEPTNHCPNIFVHETVLAALGSYRPVLQLLPNVRRMTIDSSPDPHMFASIPYLQILLGPAVERFEMLSDTPHENIPEFMASIPLCPNIAHLDLRKLSLEPPDNLAIEHLILNLKALRSINVSNLPFSRDVVRHLATLGMLVTLGRVVVGPDINGAELAQEISGHFQNLKEIEIQTHDWGAAKEILQAFQSNFTKLYMISTTKKANSPSFVNFFKLFTAHNLSSLSEVTLVDLGKNVVGSRSPLALSALKSLFSMIRGSPRQQKLGVA